MYGLCFSSLTVINNEHWFAIAHINIYMYTGFFECPINLVKL